MAFKAFRLELMLGSLVLVLLGMTAARNTHWQTPAELAQNMIQKNQTSVDALTILADNELQQGKPAAALVLLDSVLGSSAENDEAYKIIRGKTLLYNGRIDEAADLFISIRRDHHLTSNALIYLGLIAEKQNDAEAARTWYQAAVARDPANLSGFVHLSELALAQGDLPAAIRSAMEVLAENKNSTRAMQVFFNAGYPLARKASFEGDSSKGRTIIRALIEFLDSYLEERSTMQTQLFYADLISEGEQIGRALKFFRTFYEDNPGDPRVIKKYAVFCQKILLYRKAEELFTELNEVNNGSDPDDLFWLAAIQYKNHRYAEAEQSAQTVLEILTADEISGNELACMNLLAMIHVRSSAFNIAASIYDQILAQEPTFWQAYAGLADIALLESNIPLARTYINKVEELVPASYFTLIKLKGMLKKKETKRDDQERYRNQ